jgi:hypothetical protein
VLRRMASRTSLGDELCVESHFLYRELRCGTFKLESCSEENHVPRFYRNQLACVEEERRLRGRKVRAGLNFVRGA